MAKNKDLFKNIDYQNKTVSIPLERNDVHVDRSHDFYNNIIDAAESGELDINKINAFTGISRSRDQVYDLLDMMSEDPVISSALEIYASDVCEPNEQGRIVWPESSDPRVLGACDMILDMLNVDKNSYGWVYRLVKYGDLYLRLYRKSSMQSDTKEKENLNEEVIFKAYSKNDRYSGYAEEEKNPATMFDLTKYGKTYAYIRTHVDTLNKTSTELSIDSMSQFNYEFNQNDVDVFEATEYVHATLDDSLDRTDEEVSLTSGEKQELYSVKRGKSVLYDSFRIWRELSLLENAVLLNRLTRSSIVRTVSVEVGDMEKNSVKNLLARIKGLIEQKSAISTGNSIREYTNPGPMENVIYVPTHDGKGTISTSQIGGDAGVSDNSLGDLEYWKKKLFSSLGIPGQFLGDTSDSTGFNGGTSLSLISSRYAKTIKRIQSAYLQAIETAVNLILLDKGLGSYVGKFTLKMQAPTTQEEKDRKENINQTISNSESILRMVNDQIQDEKARLQVLKATISKVTSDQDIIQVIQNQIDILEQSGSEDIQDNYQDDGSSESFEFPDMGSEEELPFNDTEAEEEQTVDLSSNESFYTNKDGELLVENNLPSFEDLGIDYTTK